MQKKLEEATKDMREVGEQMTTYVTLPLAVAGAASIKLASDMQESLNKVNVAFGSSAQEVVNWSKDSVTSMGMASGSALDAAALFGDMGTSMGISQKEAAKMAMSLTQLGADLASFKNIPIEQAMSALNGVFTGETESLKMLGVVMTQTQLEAFALSKGITTNVKDMTEAEMVSLRYAFVLDRTKNAQGDFARTADGSANQMRVFTETLKEIGIQLGTIMLPVFNKFITALNNMLKEFLQLPQPIKTTIVVLGGILAAIGPVLLAVGSIAPIMASAITAIKALITIIKATSLSLALFTNPVFLTIAAIGALIAAGVLLYKNWDLVKQKFEEAKIILVNGAKYIWEKFKYHFGLLNPLLFGVIEGAKALYTNWDTVKTGVVSAFVVMKNKFVENFGWIVDGMRSFMTGLSEFASFVGSALGVQMEKVITSFGQAWEDSGIKGELALSREKYALEQRIKAINENAGKTDYMTNMSLIMTGQLAAEETQTKKTALTAEELAEAKRKAAEAARIAAEKARELARAQEEVRKKARDAADALGNAVVVALEKKRKAEEDAIQSTKDVMSKNDQAYEDSLQTIKRTQEEAADVIKDTNKKIVDDINDSYDKMRDANNDYFDGQISDRQKQIDAIAKQTKSDEQDLLEAKYKSNIQAIASDFSLYADRKKLVDKFSAVILDREKKALEDGRTVRIESIEELTDEENAIIRQRIYDQRKLISDNLKAQNIEIEDNRIKLNQQVEQQRTKELNDQQKHLDSLMNQLKTEYEDKQKELYRQYSTEQMGLDAHLQELQTNYDAYFKGLNDKQKAFELMELPKNQAALIEVLKKYNPDWYKQGQTFGERLIDGLKDKQKSIEELVASVLGTAKKGQEATVTPPKTTKPPVTDNNPIIYQPELPKYVPSVPATNFLGTVATPALPSFASTGLSDSAFFNYRANDMSSDKTVQVFLDSREITKGIAPTMFDYVRTKVGYSG